MTREPKDPTALWAQWTPFTNGAFKGWALTRYLDGNGVTGQTYGKTRLITFKTQAAAQRRADILNELPDSGKYALGARS
jgi:hypothetical protein